MNAADYVQQDAVGLADLIARREVSAVEVLEAALEQSARVNPAINAITQDLSARARVELAGGAPTGPLAGVPFLLKDLGPSLAGTPTIGGSKLWRERIAETDSPLAAAYKRAGLVIFGKTNTPEMGLEPVTEPRLFGPTRNPWDLSRTPGGSSGGAAAAVAAGIVPAAHASDGGGSIRTPASACGLFGLKPTRGRVSFAPGNEGWGGFSIHHAVTRSVRDSAVLLDAVCAPQPGDPYWVDPPATPFAAEVGKAPGRLRMGFSTEALAYRGDLDPACRDAVIAAARLCESLGHDVEEIAIPGDIAAVTAAASIVVAANVAADLDAEAAFRGRAIEADEVEPSTFALYQRGQTISASAYVQAIVTAHAFGRVMAAFQERYDVVMLSTLGSPAIPVGALTGVPPDPRGYVSRLFAFMPNTQAFNVSGQPAMTVPLAWSPEGLPIGVQFVGRMAEEGLLLRLAGQLEGAAPWAGKRPGTVMAL